jgi:hypothetical protein
MNTAMEIIPELEAASFLEDFLDIDRDNAARIVKSALYNGHKDFPIDGAIVVVALHYNRPTDAGGRWLSVTIS